MDRNRYFVSRYCWYILLCMFLISNWLWHKTHALKNLQRLWHSNTNANSRNKKRELAPGFGLCVCYCEMVSSFGYILSKDRFEQLGLSVSEFPAAFSWEKKWKTERKESAQKLKKKKMRRLMLFRGVVLWVDFLLSAFGGFLMFSGFFRLYSWLQKRLLCFLEAANGTVFHS